MPQDSYRKKKPKPNPDYEASLLLMFEKLDQLFWKWVMSIAVVMVAMLFMALVIFVVVWGLLKYYGV